MKSMNCWHAMSPWTSSSRGAPTNLFMNTGFRIDVAYNEATGVLTFSPNGDYVRVKPQPETPAEK